jgi:hypothetical protein
VGYFWSHGYRVGHGHTRNTCSNPNKGHRPTATRNNIMGGSIANKDWMPNRATLGPGPDVQAEPKPTKTSYLLKSLYKLAFAVSSSCSPPISNPSNLPVNYTSIADTIASGIYFTKHAPINHCNTSAPSICVGTADGTITCSSTSTQLKLTNLPPSARQGHVMPSFTRTLVSIAPLCNTNLTVIFTKHDVKAINQAGATILKGWHDPGGANNWHYPTVNSNYNSNEDSLFPSDDELTIIPPPNPPPEPLPPPATPVPDTYWDRIRHKRRPARIVQLTYREWLDQGPVNPTEQNKRRCIKMACHSNLNTTSFYMCLQPHALPPPTSSPQATSVYDLPSVSSLICLHHTSAGNPVQSTWFATIKAGNYKTFPGLTICNAMKHCPSSDGTIKGHLKQTCQGLHSTKPKSKSSNRFEPFAIPYAQTTDKPEDPSHKPTTLPSTNKLYITDFLLAKLYTNDTSRLPHPGLQRQPVHHHCLPQLLQHNPLHPLCQQV